MARYPAVLLTLERKGNLTLLCPDGITPARAGKTIVGRESYMVSAMQSYLQDITSVLIPLVALGKVDALP